MAIAVCVLFFPFWFTAWALAVIVAAQFDRTRAWARWLREAGKRYCYGGFTLIELSIVLVIIGLVVGGVLVGRDMIKAAEARAQITQIEKYNTAASTFRDKYGFLPGDIPAGPAAQFGFAPRGNRAGQGDGNGVIECWNGNINEGQSQCGETTMFWVDLGTAGLIDSGLNTATPGGSTTGVNISLLFPAAKIGRGNYIAVWSGGAAGAINPNSINYFSISAMTSIGAWYIAASTPALSVTEAYSIDKKVDDGLPQSGNVTAMYDGPYAGQWGTWAGAASNLNGPTTSQTPSSSSTCYDNGNVAGGTQQYSFTQNNGAGVNCALSFKMQAGD